MVYNDDITNDWGTITMDVFKIYNDTVNYLKAYIAPLQNIDDSKIKNLVLTIQESINRILFIKGNVKGCEDIEERIVKELRSLTKEIIVKSNNPQIYKKKMQRNIDFITWVNKHRALNLKARKYTVSQKEIFYAYLGDNIGSEQNGRRPVIILQNNTGNIKGNTTIIAPVTTHQKRIKFDQAKHRYYIEIIENGVEKRKYLDFYEVPLHLERDNGLYGFVNIMHIREIDRKRIDSQCVGIATNECFRNILSAINKNLS